MLNEQTLIRAMVESAGSLGEQTGKTDLEVLTAIRDAIFSNDIQNGKVLISSSEAGGTVTFALPRGSTPQETLVLIQRAIDKVNGRREIRRVRVSFLKARP